MINEFSNRQFPCDTFVPKGPGYDGVSDVNHVCSVVGGARGSSFVDGDAYINTAFSYYHSHLWRNLGVLIAMTITFCGVYLTATEFISAQRSKGEVLVFRRGRVPAQTTKSDEEENRIDRPKTQDLVASKTVSAGEVPQIGRAHV